MDTPITTRRAVLAERIREDRSARPAQYRPIADVAMSPWVRRAQANALPAKEVTR